MTATDCRACGATLASCQTRRWFDTAPSCCPDCHHPSETDAPTEGANDMTDQPTTDHQAAKAAFDDYFGVCPTCGSHDGYLNVGREHWFYCLQHKFRWDVGSNLFDSWKTETEGEQRARYEALDFGSFAEVAP